jgi:predicted SnoaL-like aldol condensation-catalyzing enzyme
MKPISLNKSVHTAVALMVAALATLAGPAASAPLQDARADITAANRALAVHLSQALLSGADLRQLGQYFAPNLIVHDPAMAGGRTGMVNAIDSLRRSLPGHTLTVKHVLADRDLVLVHSHVSKTPANEMSGFIRLDIYRLDRGLVVEHWKLGAEAPTASASGNSAFSDLYRYSGPAPALSRERIETNRLLAKAASEEVFGKQNFGLLDRLWGANYIQHNPWVGNGRAALQGVIQYISVPGKSYRVTHSLADRDLTAVCAHTVAPGGNPDNEFEGTMVCDLYRVANLELVEHWDVYQGIPSTSVSGNSMVSSLYRGNQGQPK